MLLGRDREMAAVELALRQLEVPEVNGLKLDDILEAGERLPGIAALWDVATAEAHFREAIRLAPRATAPYENLGRLYLEHAAADQEAPRKALEMAAAGLLKLHDFHSDRVIENRIESALIT